MRKLLFLDFDGVISTGMSADFQHAKMFSEWLLAHPDVEVVFSTNWRLYNSINKLRSFFDPMVGHRMIDCTPNDENDTGRGSRERQIKKWIKDNNYDGEYAILDDMPHFFENHHWHNLVITNHHKGLTPSDLNRVDHLLGYNN